MESLATRPREGTWRLSSTSCSTDAHPATGGHDASFKMGISHMLLCGVGELLTLRARRPPDRARGAVNWSPILRAAPPCCKPCRSVRNSTTSQPEHKTSENRPQLMGRRAWSLRRQPPVHTNEHHIQLFAPSDVVFREGGDSIAEEIPRGHLVNLIQFLLDRHRLFTLRLEDMTTLSTLTCHTRRRVRSFVAAPILSFFRGRLGPNYSVRDCCFFHGGLLLVALFRRILHSASCHMGLNNPLHRFVPPSWLLKPFARPRPPQGCVRRASRLGCRNCFGPKAFDFWRAQGGRRRRWRH